MIRISTPDGAMFLRAYCERSTFLNDPRHGAPVQAGIDRINLLMRQWGHAWIYDAESLTNLFRECGFRTVRQQLYKESFLDVLGEADAPGRAFESLYVEAVKE